jgi:large repetitive protein
VTAVSETAGLLSGVVLDQDSEPLSSAKVNASDESTWKVRLTNTEGVYSMPLEPGEYTVVAGKSGYSEETDVVTIATGETTWLNFTLSVTAGILEGVVRDVETDEVVASAKVSITFGETTVSFNTNSEGYYQFLDVPEGAVSVNVTKTGYESNVTEATIVAGETTTLDIYLTPIAEDEDGGSLAFILVGIGILAIVVIAALLLMRKRKSGGDMTPPPEGPAPPA